MRGSSFILISTCIAVFSIGSVPSYAATVSGTVTYLGRHAQAFVAAVPVDTVSGRVESDRAVVRMTGLNGSFSLPAPDGPYALIAWDGSRGVLVEGVAGGSVTLAMTDQSPPDAVTAASVRCTCTRLFWGLYYTCLWAEWGKIGCYIGRSCGC